MIQSTLSKKYLRFLIASVKMILVAGWSLIAFAAEPATVEQARNVIDLSKFPFVGKDPEVSHRVVASQGYSTQGSVPETAKAVLAKLKADRWKEDAGATVSDEYAMVTLSRDGYALVLSVMPSQTATRSIVTLSNAGNLDFKSLPIPKGYKAVYSGPTMAMYQTDQKAQETIDQLQSALTKGGWSSFGDVIGSFYMRRNAIKLMVSVNEAPGPDGKTTIQFAAEVLSVVFPVPPELVMLQHTDTTGRILLDTKLTQEEAIKFYTTALAKESWKVTTDEPVRIGFRDHLFFVNPAKELIDMQWHKFEGNTRLELEYQTAERVAELNAIAKKMAEDAKRKLEMESNRPVPKATIQIPKEIMIIDKSGTEIEGSAKSGEASRITKAWVEQFEKDGWKATTRISEKIAGDFELTKDDLQLNLGFIDPGFIPAKITLSVFGKGELEIAGK